jgi:uncharacterized protein (TIGR02145 family)
MKNIFIQFSIAALIVLIFGCSSGSDVNGNSNTSLPGPNITDIDGNVYQSVIICSQTWTKSNLNVSKYTDGTPIPQVSDPTQWANLTTGAWCYYNNDSSFGDFYGKLYNWYAIAGIYDSTSAINPSLRKKLAPVGYHIPTDSEWNALSNCLGGEDIAGGKMKTTGSIEVGSGFWKSPNIGATNESAFTALPSGYRFGDGTFTNIHYNANWWSITDNDLNVPYIQVIGYNYTYIGRTFVVETGGFSVRCLKD